MLNLHNFVQISCTKLIALVNLAICCQIVFSILLLLSCWIYCKVYYIGLKVNYNPKFIHFWNNSHVQYYLMYSWVY